MTKTAIQVLFITIRKTLRLSQEEMAVQVGCGRVSYSNYERGTQIPKGDKVLRVQELAKSAKGRSVLTKDPYHAFV
jgi:transcriptional regulator with XRE-family HTH domain